VRVRDGFGGSALAYLLYVLLAFLSFHPQLARPHDSVAYVGDALESVYIVAWNVHRFFSDPLRIFEANVFHPTPHALALTDHRLLPSLIVAPVVWLTGNAVLASNVAIVIACVFAAAAARRLSLALALDPIAAWAAGALYGFHTYQINEAPRLNVIFHGFLPLSLLELLRLLRLGERRHAWRCAGYLLLQGLSSNYHLLYGALLVGIVAVGALAVRPRAAAARLRELVLPGALAGLLFLPIALPYFGLARAHGYARPLPPSMGLEHYVSTLPGNLVYGEMGAEIRTQQRGPHFLGFLPLLLGLVALVASFGAASDERSALLRARHWVPGAALLGALFLALSLGRNIVLWGQYLAPGPYQLLFAFVPGFQQVRIPERLALPAMLFIALLAARGLTLLAPRLPRPILLLLAAAVPLEHVSPQQEVPRVPVGRDVPEVYRWLASDSARAVAELPIRGEGLVRAETLEMYFSTRHWKPIVHGYTAYPPLVSRVLRRAAAQFPAEVALQAFERVGVDTVVVHHGREVGVELRRQLTGRGADAEERFTRLLQQAGLDLYGQLEAALQSGRISRVARFHGEAARLYESTLDEVYRITAAPQRPAAPFPSGRRVDGARLSYAARSGETALAGDGRLDTAWVSIESLRGDEFFEVRFGEPLRVAGIVLPIRWDTPYPTRFRVEGRHAEGGFVPLARLDEAHVLQLLDAALADPARAAIGFDLGGRELVALRLAVEAGGTSFDGWAIPELEILAAAAGT
jgi:hypothetical protein